MRWLLACGLVLMARANLALADNPAGPSVDAVIRVAHRCAGLDRKATWSRRARLAGLVPWVTVRVGRDTSWQTPLDSAIGSSTNAVDHGVAVEVRATWRLDRLVFDGRELQVATMMAARTRERRELASHVIRMYFTWQRGGTGSEEAHAELDALTDGWFSARLSEPRTLEPSITER